MDKWYPVTFISRPLSEMLFYLVLFGIQIGERVALSQDSLRLKRNPIEGTTVDQALYLEPTVQLLVEAYELDGPDRDELRIEARTSSVFMSIQALIGTCADSLKLLFLISSPVLLAFGVVAYHVVHHIRRQGPKAPHLDVLKHPTCRYTPHAPSASAFFASPFDTTHFKNEISSTSLPV